MAARAEKLIRVEMMIFCGRLGNGPDRKPSSLGHDKIWLVLGLRQLFR